jgi:hypothetical protein
MGCDIHGLCEVKEKGTWKANTEKVFPNPYYDSKPKYDFQMDEFQAYPDSGRNYDWFAILADVRNGRGFAGVKTGDGFEIICEPRGVPDDATEEWMEEVNGWRGDMHSHSWLHVKDFNDFDWTQKTWKRGCITLKEYQRIKPQGTKPNDWSGNVSGPKIVIVDKNEADRILNGETINVTPRDFFGTQSESIEVSLGKENLEIYVDYEWEVEYWDWFLYKFNSVIKPMQELAKKYEDVRYVFGFDN